MQRKQKSSNAPRFVRFDAWRKHMGISSITGWRWRNAGIVRVVQIRKHLFVSEAEIKRFEQRAMAGEFATTKAGCTTPSAPSI